MNPAALAALEAKLCDPVWRLTSGELYKIAPADGSGVQPFIPRPEQCAVIEAILVDGVKKLIIPKARRLGMSTTLGIMAVDSLLFRRNWRGRLIDKKGEDADQKTNDIVRVAIQNLPDWILQRFDFPKDNDSQIAANFNNLGVSSFRAGTDSRGGSNDFLWVSEWGVIQHEDPKRSSNIRSGALPSARHGVTVVETTWAGGKGGDVWELMYPEGGAVSDWRVLFFPWWIDPRNVSSISEIDVPTRAYFAKIESRLKRDGITISEQQMRWWAAERREQGIFMARENPTFLDECWSAPIQGAVYAGAIERARAEGRICPMPVDGSNLVNTSWDLGAPENTVVWYWQIVGREIRFIDCDRGDKGTIAERIAGMLLKGYSFGKHYFPHDCEQTERTGESLLTVVRRLLPPGSVVAVPRTHSAWVGINHALELFPALAFRSPQCDDGLTALSAYRTRRQGEGALTTDEPVHDWASHPADGFRTMAEAHRAGLVAFKHTNAEVKPDWYGEKRQRRGLKAMRVS